jgi:23S rRNA pseudouridine1911/1915/1917 synthase
VHGAFPPGKTTICVPLGKDPNSAVAIKDAVVNDGAQSETHAFLVKHLEHESRQLSLVRVLLLTGRKHQIRIHLAHIGYPIVGDKLYGGDERLYLAFVNDALTPEQKEVLIRANHALHAQRVAFPWFGVLRTFACRADINFRSLTTMSA